MADLYDVVIAKNRSREIERALPGATQKVILETAFDIEARYKVYAAVDTGFMRSSAYVQAEGVSTYGQALQEASALNERATMEEEHEPPAEGMAHVVIGAEYAGIVENGGVNRPAQPALAPAVQEARKGLEERLDAMLRDL